VTDFPIDPNAAPLGFIVNPQTGQAAATGGNTPAPEPPSEVRTTPDDPASSSDGAENCCVCGGGHVVYRNYREQPFCRRCANCGCNQDVCVRTGINDPAVSGDTELQQQIAAAIEAAAERPRDQRVGIIGAVMAVLAVRDREHAALKRAHVALAAQAGRDQAAIGRVRAASDQLHRAVLNADGVPLTAYDRGVDTAVRRIRTALDTPDQPKEQS
jgi:hypothetical protein